MTRPWSTLAALDALGAPFVWDRQIAGLGGVTSCGDPLPEPTLQSIRRTRLALNDPDAVVMATGVNTRSGGLRLLEYAF